MLFRRILHQFLVLVTAAHETEAKDAIGMIDMLSLGDGLLRDLLLVLGDLLLRRLDVASAGLVVKLLGVGIRACSERKAIREASDEKKGREGSDHLRHSRESRPETTPSRSF